MNEACALLVEERIAARPELAPLRASIDAAYGLLSDCVAGGGKVLVCGNGGSAADCEHIVGELMKAFRLHRRLDTDKQRQIRETYPEQADVMIANLQRAVPAISLVSQTALMTAFGNDVSAQMLFAQQVLSYGRPGDYLLAISTSGNSENILHAARLAHIQGVRVIALTGSDGGKLKALSDIAICVPADITYQIQELHLPVYHCLCACVENELFGED